MYEVFQFVLMTALFFIVSVIVVGYFTERRYHTRADFIIAIILAVIFTVSLHIVREVVS